MDRGRKAIPVQNKACMERHIRRCQELHKKKLRDMKSSVDNNAPRDGSHLRTKAKKNALIEDRIKTIETENRILLQKMSHIMRSKGAIDNGTSAQHGHSLNIDRRKRELARINKDNLKILQRIQAAKPAYNHRKWEQDARNNDKILHNICEFRPVIGGGGGGDRANGGRRKGNAAGKNLPLFKRELYELDFDESDSIYKYI